MNFALLCTPWDEIYIKHQGATNLLKEQENFGFTPRVTHGSGRDSGDSESSSRLGLVLECPEPACARTFKSVEEIELHISAGHICWTTCRECVRQTQTRLGGKILISYPFRRRQ